jgi:hypothetical protein
MEKNILNELFEDYKSNPKRFANSYKTNKKHSERNLTCKEKITAIDKALYPYYEKYGKNKFAQIFYVIGYGHNNSICKLCNKNPVLFISFEKGYSKYCSYYCSIKDGDRVSLESRKIATDKRKKKMRILLDNPIEGMIYRQKLGEKSSYYMNLPEEKEKRSNALKQKILSGEFTPNITNTWTHRESKVDNIPFRSSFEALFYVYHNLYKCKNILFEKLRIKYTFDNKEKIYIVDFIDYVNKQVFEIKPKSLSKNDKNIAKRKALLEWCKTNDYVYYEITEDQLKLYLYELIKINMKHEFLESFKRKYVKWLSI